MDSTTVSSIVTEDDSEGMSVAQIYSEATVGQSLMKVKDWSYSNDTVICTERGNWKNWPLELLIHLLTKVGTRVEITLVY